MAISLPLSFLSFLCSSVRSDLRGLWFPYSLAENHQPVTLRHLFRLYPGFAVPSCTTESVTRLQVPTREEAKT
jgi:hypothetical protein